MSWRDWIDHGIEAQFNPRLAVGDEAESWLNGWADASLRRQADLGGVFDIAYGAHHFSLVDWLCNGQTSEGTKLHRWIADR